MPIATEISCISCEDNIWLECTSQKLPFGFIGDFTDDRDVLVITPEGGKIKHTKKYSVEESNQFIKGSCVVSNDGLIDAKVTVNSKGIQYDNKYWLETQTERDLDTHYKEQWPYINSVKVNNMNLENDKNRIEFIEDVSFQAANYAKKVGNRLLFAINVLNRNKHVPDRYRDREFPLKVNRGFTDVDEIEKEIIEDRENNFIDKELLDQFNKVNRQSNKYINKNRLISDITVNSENHSFIGGNGFAVSNCAMGKHKDNAGFCYNCGGKLNE